MTGLVGVSVADDALCAGRPQNSFVADPTNCQAYFLCQNERAISGLCPQTPNESWFNNARQACTPPGTFCSPPPCHGRNREFVPDTASPCGAWHYCLDGEISHSDICPHSLSFIAESQFCTYPLCSGTAPASDSSNHSPHVLL